MLLCCWGGLQGLLLDTPQQLLASQAMLLYSCWGMAVLPLTTQQWLLASQATLLCSWIQTALRAAQQRLLASRAALLCLLQPWLPLAAQPGSPAMLLSRIWCSWSLQLLATCVPICRCCRTSAVMTLQADQTCFTPAT